MEYGYRAAFITLSNYRKLHGLVTLRGWINRWAPTVENPTDNYLGYVSRKSRVGEDEDLRDITKERFCAIVAAMSRFENGVDADMREVEKIAVNITDTLSTEFYTKVAIGISTVVDNIKDLAKAYQEAQVALEVGKVFETEKNIISYENLGIGRLIYQLPTTLCEMFLQEVFKKGRLESLDRETLMTIQCFFENNLNVSETSRKLFVHRNTLVYRLEKIRKLTGLDLREFEHAITFKVALMVKKYLTSKPNMF